jgi:uncharacterized peroxidase-related enzyme
MSRITAIDPAKATGKAKELLDAVEKKLGLVPNMMRTMAHSPSVLEGYLNFSDALAGGSLNAKIREEIAITVASTNQCGYCLSPHHAIGKMVGLTIGEMTAAQTAKASNAKTQAILRLGETIARQGGKIDDGDLQSVRDAGLTDGEIAEVVANVALNVLTNYFNLVAQTEIDFPKVELAA